MDDSETQLPTFQPGVPSYPQTELNGRVEVKPGQFLDTPVLSGIPFALFEQICLELIKKDAKVRAWAGRYGLDGQEQYGTDLYVFNDVHQQFEVYQCKCYKTYTAAQLNKAVELFVHNWQVARGEQADFVGLPSKSQVQQEPQTYNPPDWLKDIKRFVVCLSVKAPEGSKLDDAKLELTKALNAIGLEFELWDENELINRLRESPRAVELFFGLDMVSRICLESVAIPYLEQYRNRAIFGRFPTYAPLEYTVFGRGDELKEIVRAIQTHRHVQVVGFPGVGKSTLLYSFAVEQCQQWQVALVDMRMISDKLELKDQLEAIALNAVQYFDPEFQGKALAKAKEVFQGENTCLVLDNLEDTDLLEQVRKQLNPHKLLVSSRKSKDLQGIHRLPLGILGDDDAEAMFCEQSQISDDPHNHVAQICKNLGNLPLAIKLIASYRRTYQLTLAQVADEVTHDFEPEAEVSPDDEDLKRAEYSVRSAFELSYRKLTDTKTTFLAFGILSPNGATCGSVAYVLDTSHFAAWKQLQALKNLSLVEVVDDYNLQASEAANSEDTQAHTFFRTHKLLGDFAREKLTQDPSTQASLTGRVAALLQDVINRANNHKPGYKLNPDLPVVGLHREQVGYLGILHLSTPSPDANIAQGMNNASVVISEAGYRTEALQLNLETSTAYRKLVEHNRDAFLPNLAASLNNLSTFQRNVGDREGALNTIQEAVNIRRELAARNREVFLPDLAKSLNNLGICQSDAGDQEGALNTIQEAVSIRHELVARNREVFLPDLASSLNDLSQCQRNVGDREGALNTIQEAVNIRSELVARNPQVFLPDLAKSLINLGDRQSSMGDRESALSSALEALRIQRQLYEINPSAFVQDLVTNYGSLGDAYQALDQIKEARAAVEEGLRVVFPVLKAYPRAFASVTQELIRLYLIRSKQLQTEPDLVLIEQVSAILESLEKENGSPIQQVLNQFEPLLQAIASIALGNDAQKTEIEELLSQEETGWQFPQAVRRIWTGERELQALVEGMDEQDTALIRRVLEIIQSQSS